VDSHWTLETGRRADLSELIMRAMGSQDRMNKAVPRWLWGLLGGLPGLAVVAMLLVMGFTGPNRIFNLSTRDSFLIAGIGSVLIGLVLSLSILCVILLRAMR
jgi:hypothetical protein